MEYLLVMSLSGSLLTTVYLLLHCLFKDKICARLFDPIARVAILYYLVPLPYLKQCYVALIRVLRPKDAVGIERVPLAWRNYIVYAEGSPHANVYAVLQTTAATVWLLGIGLLMARQIVEYARMVRLAAGYADRVMTPEQKTLLDHWKRQYKIRRRVYLYEAPAQEHTMTFGFFRPVIVCGRKVTSREAELLVRHELVHIRRMDALWKICMQMAAMLHWWNPLVWMLGRDFEQVCECSCDEIVMWEKTDEEVREYLRLMIEEACEKKTQRVSPRWKSGFGDNVQKIKERMENLMRKKRWNRVAAVTLVAALTFANSMTVFAYRDPFQREVTENAAQEEIENRLHVDTALFAPEGTGEEEIQAFEVLEELDAVADIVYENQFTDEAGHIYPVLEDEGIEPYCNHTFVSGTLTDHRKLSDGGCVVTQYKAQRCSKCGYVIEGELLSTHTYVTCPH